MAFAIPSLLELSRKVYGNVRARLRSAASEILPNNLRLFGKVVAMAAHEADLRTLFLFRQIFTSTAAGDYLDLHAYEVGLSRRPAAAATGRVTVTIASGVTVPAGLRFLRGDGAAFVSTASVLGTGAPISCPVSAEEAGPSGNTLAATPLSLAASVTGVDDDATIDDGLSGGVAREGDEPLRQRVLFRKRNRPRGGADADYADWALQVPGIARAFVKGWSPGAGSVSVWPLVTGSGAAAIPAMPVVEAVAAHLETRRPTAATVFVHQATARPIPVVIAALSPDVLAVRGEIVAELQDLFDERAAVALPDEASSFSRSWVAEAVAAAIGEDRHALTAPAADVVLTPGQFPVLGAVTFA